MKLLTINTHSLIEENYQQKFDIFVNAVTEIKPDIIALQEVNQTRTEKPVFVSNGYHEADIHTIIRSDNHILNTVRALSSNGIDYFWTYLPIKCGYDIYDEGIGIMSLSRITDCKVIHISNTDDYNNWKTRKIIGIKTAANPGEWFYSVHYGWWNDKYDSFFDQWTRTLENTGNEKIWLMGDFNNPANIRNEGYDLITKSGFHDVFLSAQHKSGDITAYSNIDGWKDKNSCQDGIRIDYIFCNKKTDIKSYNVIFDGNNYSPVSDHYGVFIEY